LDNSEVYVGKQSQREAEETRPDSMTSLENDLDRVLLEFIQSTGHLGSPL
jgi:hypothetical protein